uniref:Deoxyribonuclease 1 like 3 n=1 Tax=Calidris pygmaea TaxID=425635 RepID=A0A8C3KRB5_9CHAR
MLLFILLSLFNFNPSLSLKICSFNVRSFGETKIARPEVVDAVVKIISRCDITLLMEIKENKNRVCPLLVQKLTSQLKGSKEEYSCVISERLGRKSYKEQYAFIYRQDLVSVKQTYQYPDTQPGDEDAFSREPFAVWFQSPKTGETFQKQIILPLVSLAEPDGASWTWARGEGRRKETYPDPTLHFLTRAASALGAAASGVARSSVHTTALPPAAPGKPLPPPQAVGPWMYPMPLVQPQEQPLPWVSEQGLPCPDTAPHLAAQLMGSPLQPHSRRP